MIKADLHIHTEYSLDGELSTLEILNKCKLAGLSVIAITDHNLVKGVSEALTKGPSFGIRVVTGIEIDCCHEGIDLHVLGYNIDHESADFAELENQFAAKVMDSFSAMIQNLRTLGIPADASEVLARADGRLPSGELIAEVLLENGRYRSIAALDPYRTGGVRSDMPFINFYLDYFAQGKPAYVKIDYMDYSDTVSFIKKNGGIPVVAHPGHNLRGREEIVRELLDKGAEGLEVFNNYHSREQIRYFAGIALERKVLMTCGSDFHGKTKPLIRVGEYRELEQYEDYTANSISKLLGI